MAKGSYNTSVRTGNWVEDVWGKRLADRPFSLRTGESESSSRFVAPPLGGFELASAPRPLDSLDGHLVMAHGTRILQREPDAEVYMSMAAGTGRGITASAMTDVQQRHAAVGHRTELINEKARQVRAGTRRRRCRRRASPSHAHDAHSPLTLRLASAPRASSPGILRPSRGARLRAPRPPSM